MYSSSMQFEVSSPQRKNHLIQYYATGTTGVAEVDLITVPATAAAAQGDYFVISNKAGQKMAVWLDIDAAGVAPTGAAYLAATFKVKASIVTGNTAAQNAAVVAAAATLLPNVVPTDNLDGTVTFTANLDGAATAPAVHNTGDTGAGSFIAAVTTAGVTSNVALGFGFRQGTIVEGAGAGDYTITFAEPFVQVPQVIVLPEGNAFARIASVSKTAVRILTFSNAGVAKDSDIHVLCYGSKDSDFV